MNDNDDDDDDKSDESVSSDIWDEELYPKALSARLSNFTRLAPLEQFADKYEKKDPGYTIEKLHELISDPVTKESKPWISRLLENFLRDIGDDGFVSFF